MFLAPDWEPLTQSLYLTVKLCPEQKAVMDLPLEGSAASDETDSASLNNPVAPHMHAAVYSECCSNTE